METLNLIVKILKEKGVTQKELMDYLGKSPNIFTDWLGQRNRSYFKYLRQIAEFLEVDLVVLLNPNKYIQMPYDEFKLNKVEVSTNKAKIIALLDELNDEQLFQVLKFVEFTKRG